MLHGAISDQNLKCNISCNGHKKKSMVPRNLNATYLAMATKNKKAKKCNISCNAHKKKEVKPTAFQIKDMFSFRHKPSQD